jgi:HEAT repeat protein
MRRSLSFILILLNICLLIGIIWLYGQIGEKGRAISRLQEQVAYLTENLPAERTPESELSLAESEGKILSLIEDLKKSNLIKQYQAGLKLKKMGPPAVPYLVEALKDSTGKESRPILLLLEGLGDKDLTPELINIYQSSEDKVNRAGIIAVLGQWSDERARNLLYEATKEGDWRIRTTAAQALTQYEGEDILTALIRLLGDRNRYVRSAAQNAIKDIASREGGTSALSSILHKGDDKTRYLLVRNLPKIAANDAKQLLEIAAKDGNKTVREAPRKALAPER